MKGQTPLKDLKANDRVAHLLRISGLELKVGKAGKPFLTFAAGDKDVTLLGKRWDSTEADLNKFKDSKVVFITGKIEMYKEKAQLVAESIALPSDEVTAEDIKNLYPSTKYNIDFLKKELWRFIQSMENKYIKALSEALVKDPIVKEKLPNSIAALSYHHSYFGGLLTHIVRLMYMAEAVVGCYNTQVYPDQKYKINRDLILFGCFAHDLYKINEYQEMIYSPNGNLVPHLPKGAIEASRKMDKIEGFPEELRMQIEHLLLSHHGQEAWGSPVTPKTVEAVLLHYLDNMAAKVDPIIEALDAVPEGETWSPYIKAVGGPAYMGGMIITEMTNKMKKES